MKQYSLLLIMAIFSIIPVTGQKMKAIDDEGTKCHSRFNSETMETVTGKIAEIQQISTQENMALGTHLTIVFQGEELVVHVGPSWYLKQMEIDFEKGDSVAITGSKIMFEGQPTIIVSTITQENLKFVLRDKNGLPKWSTMCKNNKGGGNCRYKS